MNDSRVIEIESGTRFGQLVVIERDGTNPRGDATWLCRCDCGMERVITGAHLRRGQRSCGCLRGRGDHAQAHGMTDTPEYTAWRSMIGACENPRRPTYHRYGGRGIAVCEAWRSSFVQFYDDVGPKPKDRRYALQLIDPDRDFEPGNVHWAIKHGPRTRPAPAPAPGRWYWRGKWRDG